MVFKKKGEDAFWWTMSREKDLNIPPLFALRD
jgi:hypothetical protein